MDLISTLAEIVGAEGLLTGDDVRKRFVSWVDQGPCQALAIVRPATTEIYTLSLHDALPIDPGPPS